MASPDAAEEVAQQSTYDDAEDLHRLQAEEAVGKGADKDVLLRKAAKEGHRLAVRYLLAAGAEKDRADPENAFGCTCWWVLVHRCTTVLAVFW